MFTNTCFCSKKKLCNIGRKECILFMIMQIKTCLNLGHFVWVFCFFVFKVGCLSAHRFLDGNNTSTPNTLKGYGAHFQWERIIIPLS